MKLSFEGIVQTNHVSGAAFTYMCVGGASTIHLGNLCAVSFSEAFADTDQNLFWFLVYSGHCNKIPQVGGL